MSRASAGGGATVATVVELAALRRTRRRDELLAGLVRAQDGNRRAVARLVYSNLLWTRRGARAGRQLLSNWERLVEETDRLKRLDLPLLADEGVAEPLFAVVEALLVKSEKLASRSAELFAQTR